MSSGAIGAIIGTNLMEGASLGEHLAFLVFCVIAMLICGLAAYFIDKE